MIRVLVVDDEPLAREKIRLLLQDEDDVEILGDCGDGVEAVKAIQKFTPDLIFLDIQMPELDGFGVLKALEKFPEVIFTTAYDQYALQAFEFHALDYLLKPFDRARFQESLARAKERIREKKDSKLSEQIETLLQHYESGYKRPARIAIKSSGRIYFVEISDIDWIEAAGNYVKLHIGPEAHLHRETLKGMEEKLDPSQFARIHRSTIVHVERIKELQPFFNGEYVLILQDGKKLTMSRRHRDKIQELLDQTL